MIWDSIKFIKIFFITGKKCDLSNVPVGTAPSASGATNQKIAALYD